MIYGPFLKISCMLDVTFVRNSESPDVSLKNFHFILNICKFFLSYPTFHKFV